MYNNSVKITLAA